MAFEKKQVGPTGGQSLRGKAPQLFAYKTSDALAAVKASGYFNEMADMVEAGDIFIVSTVSSGAATGCYILAVAGVSAAGVVTTVVANYTAA